MKTFFTLSMLMGAAICACAQSFSDNFDSYTNGSFLASSSSEWTTWSGTAGGGDDVTIVNDNAYSGSQSIYFEAATSAGGPDDIVLPFGAQYSTGMFYFDMMMYINTGAGSYFNFQGETTIGQEWSMECTMNQNGDLVLSNTGGQLLTGTYDVGEWVHVAFAIDLNQNDWELFIDSVSQGSFSNNINRVASLNIYAYNNTNGGNGVSEFWIDDVNFEYESTALPNLNGALTAISPISGLVGQDKSPVVTVRNLGQQTITSVDVELHYNGLNSTESITGLNLASYEEVAIEVDETITLVSDSMAFMAVITAVNGGSDDDDSDDSASIGVAPIQPGLNKMVVVEEGTGTWCGWCPRGTVWMAYMQENYPDHFIGVAVHNSDPMENTDYDDGLGGLISGYPSALVDRGADIDPSAIEPDFMERVVMDASASLCVNASESGDTLKVKMTVSPTVALNSDWRVGIIITEDSVTGTGTDYAQANYYSGGASGELSGAGKDWHNEPNPVPASSMVYDHVARLIEPGFNGMEDAFPNGADTGMLYSFDFDLLLESDWDKDYMHLIAVLMDDNGSFDNGTQISYASALSNVCPMPVGVESIKMSEVLPLKVYPNPASDFVWIEMAEKNNETARLTVMDVSGRIVQQQAVNLSNGKAQWDASQLPAGVYSISMLAGHAVWNASLIKQ